MIAVLAVCVGAFVGAPTRYLVDRAVQSRHDTLVPWGTLLVNVAGCLLLGFLTGLARDHDVPPAVLLGLGTGFCGALTTYSTFAYETLRLLEDGARLYAALNLGLGVVAGLGASVIGFTLAGIG